MKKKTGSAHCLLSLRDERSSSSSRQAYLTQQQLSTTRGDKSQLKLVGTYDAVNNTRLSLSINSQGNESKVIITPRMLVQKQNQRISPRSSTAKEPSLFIPKKSESAQKAREQLLSQLSHPSSPQKLLHSKLGQNQTTRPRNQTNYTQTWPTKTNLELEQPKRDSSSTERNVNGPLLTEESKPPQQLLSRPHTNLVQGNKSKQTTPIKLMTKNKRSTTNLMFVQPQKQQQQQVQNNNQSQIRVTAVTLLGQGQDRRTNNVVGGFGSQMHRKRQQPQQMKKQKSQPVLNQSQRQFLARSNSGLQTQLLPAQNPPSSCAYGPGTQMSTIASNDTPISKLQITGTQQSAKKPLFPCRSTQQLAQACHIGPRNNGIFGEKNLAPKMLSAVSILDMGYQSEEHAEKWLPLHEACIERDSIKVEKLIRQHKQPVNQLSNGQTPLQVACQIKCKPVIERLLLARAKTDLVDSKGDTCLHVIARSYTAELWDLVLPFCLEVVHLKNIQNKSAVDLLPQKVRETLVLPTPIKSVSSKAQTVLAPPTSAAKFKSPAKELSTMKKFAEDETIKVPEIKASKSAFNLKPRPQKTKPLQDSSKRKSEKKIYSDRKSPITSGTVTRLSHPTKNQIGPEDFVAHQLLGNGSFGEVFLIERKIDKQLLAMKVLTKKKVREQNLHQYALTERNVMSSMGQHPFIVQLLYAFQTTDRLFLVSDYASGGDLSQYLEIENLFSEDKAKLYITEILLALEALHADNIIYRDLKPDNVLMDKEGHVMLTDFGLSRENVKRGDYGARSFCGSYAYLAPEMVKKKGHGKAVDWYLLGVIFYEMLTGLPPYYADDKEELFQNILSNNFTIDANMYGLSDSCVDLLKKLLEKDPLKRLGHQGAPEIKAHPFFKDTDWDSVMRREQQMPEAYLSEMALDIIKQQPYLVAGHPSTVGRPCHKDHPAYLKNWSFVYSKQK